MRRAVSEMDAACLCHPGKVRLGNEDNFYFDGAILPAQNRGTPEALTACGPLVDPLCLAVFDGMGGEACGEQAAWLAADTLRQQLCESGEPPDLLLENACQAANQRICDAAERLGGGRMGATAAVLYFSDSSVWVCNLGDSRIYRLRGGLLRQLSVDHTEAALMRSQGVRGRKPLLTQHLGIWPHEMRIEPHIAEAASEAGDQYLICSDGLTDLASPEEIARVMEREAHARDAVMALVSLALSRGGKDNITAIVCNTRGPA